MATWSSRRKTWYGVLTAFVIVCLVGVPSFLTFYKAPTCMDGVKNGTEGGVDCGGVCTKLCSSSFVPLPSPTWVRMKEVSPGVYNVAAYIVNPNTKGIAKNVPYKIELLDEKAITIGSANGIVTIPPGRNTLAFRPAVSSGKQKAVRAVFTLTGDPDWILASDPLSMLETTAKDYVEGADGSSLQVSFRNKSALPLENITVYAVLKDKDDNAIDFSKTSIDLIQGNGTEIAPFTWPTSHDGQVISIEVLPVAE